MNCERIKIYGHDTEGKSRRGLDCILDHGKLYIESINREGHKIKTPAATVAKALKKLQQQQQQPG